MRRRGHVAPRHLYQRLVGGGVADQDPSGDARAAVGDDETFVDLGHRIGVGDRLRARRGGECVAEAGDVNPHELELRREVGAGERGVAAQEAIGDDPRHLVPR